MVGGNKILTVSYGTFSCTLEGFEDPFSTMKAIAEYFRDLAAQDRYFGAEPPQPDAAMLHRIAEREIQGRVEARVNDTGVVLRAGDDTSVTPAPVAASPVVVTPEPQPAPSVTEPVAAAVAAAPDLPAPVAQEAPAPQSPPQAEIVEDDQASILDRLSRLNDSPVADAAADAVAAAPQFDSQLSDTLAAVLAGTTDQIAPQPSAAPAFDAAPAPMGDDTISNVMAALAQDMGNDAAPAIAAPWQDSLPEDYRDEIAEDFAEQDFAGFDAAPVGDLATFATAVVPAVTAPLPADDSADDDADEPDTGDDQRAAAAAEKLQRARARVVRLRRDDLGPELAAAAAAATAPVQPVVPVRPRQITRSQPEAAPAIEPTRPSRVAADARRSFGDTASEDAMARLLAQADSQMEGEDARRRQSAIQHLKAAVAATQAERRVTGQTASPDPANRMARYRDDLAMAVRAPDPNRAAPLVLVSEQRVDAPAPAPLVLAQDDADLAAALSDAPQPPAAAPAPAPAPLPQIEPDLDADLAAALGDAPAPAMGGFAVSDAPADEEPEPADTAMATSADFPEFIERLGAKSLTEVLEAAAAYMACVQHRPSFSRPQLMRHLSAAVGADNFQREDGLRSFGTLLRNGRLARLDRGQYALTEDSPYLAEGKRIAG